MDCQTAVSDLLSFLNTFRGSNFIALAERVHFASNAKNKNALLIRRLLEGFKGPEYLGTLCEFANLSIKTIQLKENGRPKEAMSFSSFDYIDIVNETWEASQVKRTFSKTFLFAVFQQTPSLNLFKGAFLWKMPDDDLLGEVKEVWQRTVDILKSGRIVVCEKGRMVLAFPRESETKVCHVRPHGKNALDLSKLPVLDSGLNYKGLSKQSFWLNHGYVGGIVNKNFPD